MPDILMCQDSTCPLRMKCYRYRAIPTEGRQSYGYFLREKDALSCDVFKPIYPGNTHLVPEEDLK